MRHERIHLKTKTPDAWATTALSDFNAFLIDHAANERKASAMGMNFVVRYHDKPELIESMIRFAREELYHFHQVTKLILKRGLKFGADEKDPYIKLLTENIRHGREEQLLDRLLVCGITEARGLERFGLIAKFTTDEDLKIFYSKLVASELGHELLFLKLAYDYFNETTVNARLEALLAAEAKIVETLPLRAAVH